MKTAIFSARPYDKSMLAHANAGAGHELRFLEDRLTASTAALATGCDAVCVFVNDTVDAEVLALLARQGVSLVATRSTGYHHIDVTTATRLGIAVVRVTDYSPHSVAEFAVGLLLAVNRKIARASARTRDGNFDLHGLMGFGCTVVGHDRYPSQAFEALGGRYVGIDELLDCSDVVSLHCPLTEDTRHIVNAASLARAKRGSWAGSRSTCTNRKRACSSRICRRRSSRTT